MAAPQGPNLTEDRQVLERGRGCIPPDPSHCNAKERAHGKECREGLDGACANLKDTTEEQVEHKRPLASEAVTDDAEDYLDFMSSNVGLRGDDSQHRVI